MPGSVFFEHFGSGDVGRHQVGCELNSAELQTEQFRDRFHQQRLGQPRRSGNQTVPAGEQRNQQLPHDILLSDHDPAELGINLPTKLTQLIDDFSFAFRRELF